MAVAGRREASIVDGKNSVDVNGISSENESGGAFAALAIFRAFDAGL